MIDDSLVPNPPIPVEELEAELIAELEEDAAIEAALNEKFDEAEYWDTLETEEEEEEEEDPEDYDDDYDDNEDADIEL